MRIPPLLARNVAATWGAEGERWLAGLPGLAAAVARTWELELGAPFALTYHWVAAAACADGTPVVLKLGVPGSAHLAVEARTLAAYGGHGAVRLLAHDPARGALLLERARPGVPATALVPARDAEATAAAVEVLRRLHAAAPPDDGSVPLLHDERAAFARHLAAHPSGGPLPQGLVARALALFDELSATAPAPVLLHGDLHHDNVLAATREPWLAIDPHGLAGDPGYDAGALLYNPDPDRRDERLVALVPARVEQLADGLGLPAERVHAWGFVKAVLAEVWTVGSGATRPARPGRGLDVALALLPGLP